MSRTASVSLARDDLPDLAERLLHTFIRILLRICRIRKFSVIFRRHSIFTIQHKLYQGPVNGALYQPLYRTCSGHLGHSDDSKIAKKLSKHVRIALLSLWLGRGCWCGPLAIGLESALSVAQELCASSGYARS